MTFGAVIFGDIIFGATESDTTTSVQSTLSIPYSVYKSTNRSVQLSYSVYEKHSRDYSILWGVTEIGPQVPLNISWDIESPTEITTTLNKYKLPKSNRSRCFKG